MEAVFNCRLPIHVSLACLCEWLGKLGSQGTWYSLAGQPIVMLGTKSLRIGSSVGSLNCPHHNYYLAVNW